MSIVYIVGMQSKYKYSYIRPVRFQNHIIHQANKALLTNTL